MILPRLIARNIQSRKLIGLSYNRIQTPTGLLIIVMVISCMDGVIAQPHDIDIYVDINFPGA